MVAKTTPIVGEQSITTAQLAITSDSNSSGQLVSQAVTTVAATVKNIYSKSLPIEYQVGGGAWVSLAAGKTARLEINLAAVALRIRRGPFTPSPMPVDIDSEAGSPEPTPIVVSSAAPSNSDGRPDGTIYIQTA